MPKFPREVAAGLYAGTANLHPRESLFNSGTINSLNGEVAIPLDGCATLSFVAAGTYVGTLTAEGSVDGVNWDPVFVRQLGSAPGIYTFVLASAVQGRWQGPVGPFRFGRVRMSAFTSGSVAVTLVGENGVADLVAHPKLAELHVTNTGVSGAAVTLTLPAPSPSQVIGIARFVLQRHAAAALTAGATPSLVNTTNLPGSRVFSVPVEAATQGSVYGETVEPAMPLRATNVNTAVTFVAPAVTGVIWRMSADYSIFGL